MKLKKFFKNIMNIICLIDVNSGAPFHIFFKGERKLMQDNLIGD